MARKAAEKKTAEKTAPPTPEVSELARDLADAMLGLQKSLDRFVVSMVLIHAPEYAAEYLAREGKGNG